MANGKLGRKKQHAEIVTGDFELHFEEVVNRNRYTLVALITGGLLLLTILVPGVTYYSQAKTKNTLIEAESGQLINDLNVKKVPASNSNEPSYVEFILP